MGSRGSDRPVALAARAACALARAAALAPATAAAEIAGVPSSHDGSGTDLECSVASGGNAGERHCAGIFTTFEGAPIDVNIGFPPEPASGPDGDFPVVGVFHGWGGSKLAFGSAELQRWLDDGYAVFTMNDRGWGMSCGGTDPKRVQPVCADGYNHLMDTCYEVRHTQETFEALADRDATGAGSGEGPDRPACDRRHRRLLRRRHLDGARRPAQPQDDGRGKPGPGRRRARSLGQRRRQADGDRRRGARHPVDRPLRGREKVRRRIG